MTVKTIFSKKDFDKILLNYNLESYKDFKPFKLGAVQTNLLLITTKGKYVLRYYESRSKNYALFEACLLNYLVQHSYPCPAPIENIKGKFVGLFRNKPLAIFEFMKGTHSKSASKGRKVARALGKLHQITIGYKPKYHQSRDTYDPKSCLKYAVVNLKKIKSKSLAKKRMDWLRAELKKLQLPKALPRGVCHCDTHPSNFLYKKGKLSAVLDFDDASYIYLLYDLANLIYFWAWPHKKKLLYKKVKELLKEYSKYRKLNELEREHLYDFLKMVIFMSIGWFIHVEDDFISEKRKIDFLNSIGRENFYNKIFN